MTPTHPRPRPRHAVCRGLGAPGSAPTSPGALTVCATQPTRTCRCTGRCPRGSALRRLTVPSGPARVPAGLSPALRAVNPPPPPPRTPVLSVVFNCAFSSAYQAQKRDAPCSVRCVPPSFSKRTRLWKQNTRLSASSPAAATPVSSRWVPGLFQRLLGGPSFPFSRADVWGGGQALAGPASSHVTRCRQSLSLLAARVSVSLSRIEKAPLSASSAIQILMRAEDEG